MPPRRRKKSRVNKILVVTAVVALLLCVWSSVFSLTHTPDFIKNAIVTVSSPFTYLFDRAGGAIHGLFADSPDEAAYKARIEQLEQQLAAERAKTAQLQQLQLENAQLKEFLDISDQNRALVLLHAKRIYAADTTSRRITLSRGTRDGVSVGMPVLDQNGLLGVVCEVSGTSCLVSTLLDETVYVGARNARSGVSGTLCGTPSDEDTCTLKYMDANMDYLQDLRVGDVILTGGGSERDPEGLPIGTIVKVGVDSYDRSPYALVAPYADITDATSLLMIVTGEREVSVDDPAEDDPTEDGPAAPADPEQGEGDEPTEPPENGSVGGEEADHD